MQQEDVYRLHTDYDQRLNGKTKRTGISDMKNLDWNIYTYRHRRAFAYCVSRLIHDPVLKQEMLKRAEVHDMDKMLMYLFLDQHTA